MRWLRLVVPLAGLALHGAAQADSECRPLRQVVRESAQAGHIGFLFANEIASEPGAAGGTNGTTKRNELASRARKTLEEMVDQSLDAGGFAEDAVASGAIPQGGEAQFVVRVRQRLHAGLLRERATASWLVMVVNPATKSGMVLVRRYEFPREGQAGLMNGADQLCVRNRVEQASRWPADKPATVTALLGRGEAPDCGTAAAARMGCSGLGQQLEVAAAEGESVYATARSSRDPVLWVYTRNARTGRGRALHVQADGTTLVDSWLFNVDAPRAQ